MTTPSYQIIDNNTGDRLSPASGFRFLSVPEVGHVINDPDLTEHFGAKAVVQRLEAKDKDVLVYVDSSGEVFNSPHPEV